jgi:peptide/nickel transport system substrate-binding protein
MTKARTRWSGLFPLAASLALVASAAATSAPAGASPSGRSAGKAARSAAAARSSHKSSASNVASYALTTGDQFNWILPLENQNAYEPWEWAVEDGSWVPLYVAGKGSSTVIDYTISIGKKPVYSDGNTTVTITLNTDFTWSNGTPVTSTDLKFFFQLDEGGKHTLGDYLPGELPDDLASVTYPGPHTVVLHLTKAYNPTWFTSNQLTWLYPLPAQSWDKTCTTCPVGSAANTPSGAAKVLKYLFKQSSTLRTYPTNPLWKTVDGPWVISAYDTVSHDATFVANSHYTGPTKPKLAGYKIFTFTTITPEVNALRAGNLTYGLLPLSDLSEESYFKQHGFVVKPWKLFYNEDMEFGYTSKTYGPLVKQLYIRQALQHLVTEQLYISKTFHGYGIPDYGVISDFPGSSLVSPTLRKDPYPYSVSAAKKLLSHHGWKAGSNGVDVCERAGTGPTDCGAGIKKGKALSLLFMFSTGTTAFTAQVSAFQTAAKKAGVGINLDGQSEQTMFSIAGVCPKTPPCKYGLAGYSVYLWDYGQYDGIPSGDDQFGKGNFWAGGYYTATAQQLINAADTSGSNLLPNLYADENYLSKNVASLWWPLEDSIVVVKKQLKGWTLNPYGTITPQDWYFSGS